MKRLLGILMIMTLAVGCNLIDDDLSVCGTDYVIHYEMRLVTDLQMTIDEKLSLEVEKPIADTLKSWLAPIFSGVAHDLDISFYSLNSRDELKYHFSEVINANQKSYTLYIPREDYMHLAVVNIANNAYVSLAGEQQAATMRIEQVTTDSLPTQPTAVYTARKQIIMPAVQQDTVESFDVHLYMVSSAVALVIDSSAIEKPKMSVLLSGSATGFEVQDSIFTYDHPSLIHAERLTDKCYAVVALPSKNNVTVNGKSGVKDNNPALWSLRVYVTKPDNTITETILSVPTPLKAGTLEIIRVQVGADGSVIVLDNPEVGASVTLDWKNGTEHEIEM